MSGVTDWMASAQVCNLSHMPKLILFDIDGTLVLTGGAGIRAMNRAGEEILGVLNLLDGIACAGRTDWIILHDALTKAGHELDEALFARMRDAHIRYLAEEIEHPGDGVKDVMPGIRELLPVLQSRDDVFLGLLTGNFADAAEVKLAHFDLWRYFRCGAFGEDAHDRNHLVPVALDRARGRGLPDHVDAGRTVVIGDTPRDIACARAHGARVVAVATGEYKVDALKHADVVFADFSDTQAVLDAILVMGTVPRT